MGICGRSNEPDFSSDDHAKSIPDYKLKNIQITNGSLNIPNEYPGQHDPALTESGGLRDAVQMGFSGAFYYTKPGSKF